MSERTGVLLSLRDDLDLVRRAERLGYESVWAAEGDVSEERDQPGTAELDRIP